MSGWRDDLHSAFRYLRRRPLFALSITATLAIAIGAAATAFGIATAVLWRPLPFRDAARLVFLWETTPGDRNGPTRVSGARYAAWRDAPNGLASVALFGATGFTMDDGDGARSIRAVRVSPNYFDTLGIQPLLGRTFTAADGQPGNHRVVILSHAFWREQFGGRPDAVGESITLSGQPHTVVGVMPNETFPVWALNPAIVTLDAASRQLWVPIQQTPQFNNNAGGHVYGVLARLGFGLDAREVTDRLDRTSETSADRHHAYVQPFRQQFVAASRAPLLALIAAAIAVLLIACTNLAALYVSAFESRRAELAVRVAIGAGVSRLVRQFAFEAWLLSSSGALIGIGLARLALATVPRWLPPSIPMLTIPRIEGTLVLFAVALASIAGLILNGWPIVRMIVAAPAPRGNVASHRSRVYHRLVVAQVAVTLALAVVAGLLTQSLQMVERQDPGFAVEGVMVATVGLPSAQPPDPGLVAQNERAILATVRSRPSVRAVAAAYDHPLADNWSENLAIVGDSTAEEQRRQVELRIVSPGYFEALDVELLDGRTFGEGDTFAAPGVAIVNEAFARAVGGRLLGRRVRSAAPRFLYSNAATEFEIVGIVRNERFRGLEQPAVPAYYLSTRQFPQAIFMLLVRTERDPLAVSSDVRAAVRSVSTHATFSNPTSLERILSRQLAQRRVTTTVISGFAGVALVLAALGIYGLLAVLVGSRRRDIGVRLAIGASPGAVAREVVGEGLRSAAAGIGLGAVLALVAGTMVRGLLLGVAARDPRTLAIIAVLLLVVALAAAIIPAQRAARIDPAEALRME